MALRTHDGFLWLARSDDHGRTWAQAERSTLVGAESSSNLLTLADGRLLLTYDQSAPPLRSPLVMRTSADGGRTWGPAGLVALAPDRPDAATWGVQASYPSVAEVGGGEVAVVWASLVLAPESLYGSIQSARIALGRSP
jgi:BNR repeat-like domain